MQITKGLTYAPARPPGTQDHLLDLDKVATQLSDRIAIRGGSSGGWTTAMGAATGELPALEGDVGVRDRSSAAQAAVPFYPPTGFLQMDAHMPGTPPRPGP